MEVVVTGTVSKKSGGHRWATENRGRGCSQKRKEREITSRRRTERITTALPSVFLKWCLVVWPQV